MKTLILLKTEHFEDEIIVQRNYNNIEEGFFKKDTTIKIIDKKAQKKLKELGVDVEQSYKNYKSFNEDEETEEKIYDILENLECLEDSISSYFCEDIYTDVESLSDDIYLCFEDCYVDKECFVTDEETDEVSFYKDCTLRIIKKEDIYDYFEKQTFLIYDSGHDFKCDVITDITEIEVEELCEDDEEIAEFKKEHNSLYYKKTFHYDYYKTKNNEIFRVYNTYMQNELDTFTSLKNINEEELFKKNR